MEKNVRRVQFYLKKIAELDAIHPTRRDDRWYCRAVRLESYKKVLNAILKA